MLNTNTPARIPSPSQKAPLQRLCFSAPFFQLSRPAPASHYSPVFLTFSHCFHGPFIRPHLHSFVLFLEQAWNVLGVCISFFMYYSNVVQRTFGEQSKMDCRDLLVARVAILGDYSLNACLTGRN